MTPNVKRGLYWLLAVAYFALAALLIAKGR
jgi:hypothetical protein